jgi:hypothetical protein
MKKKSQNNGTYFFVDVIVSFKGCRIEAERLSVAAFSV